MTTPPPLILVDGSGYIFRAYHALPPLSRSDGTPVGAVYGFASMLLKLLETEEDGFVVIFDAGRKTFRNDIYPDYKAHRPPPPDDLIPQFPLTRSVCEAFGVTSLEIPGFEADDLIASYTKEALKKGIPVKIISGDKDLMQLISSEVSLFDPLKNKIIGPQEVLEKFGVAPLSIIDVLALMGDASDNIPGVPGIGPKGAADLIQRFSTLENLLDHIEDVSKPSHKKSLLENIEKARLSKKLIQLHEDVPLPKPLSDLKIKSIETSKIISFLKEQGFQSLIPRVERYLQKQSTSIDRALTSLSDEPLVATPPLSYELILTEEALQDFLKEALKYPKIAVDTETTSLNALRAELVGISLCYTPGVAAYIPLNHKKELSLLDQDTLKEQLTLKKVIPLLKPLFENSALLKIGHNIKYDLLVLKNHGLNIFPIDDTMVISYVLDGTKTPHNLDHLSSVYFNHTTIKYKDLVGVGKSEITFDYVPLDKACQYAAEDADFTLRLHDVLKPRLIRERLNTVYETLDRPLISILEEMEFEGILVNPQALRKLSTLLSEQMTLLEHQIHILAGRPFNLASPKQLSEILFSEMGLETGKKGKMGDFSTRAGILESLADQGHELPKEILKWRGLAKLKSTYTDTLISQINPKTHRVHTSYAMTRTSTGRLSSSDPNLQNIPIRTEDGLRIRKAFLTKPGHFFLSLDYSQIELRLLAHVAKIPSLIEAFLKGHDIHAITASLVFSTPLEKVDETLRHKAKAINFGIIYGISPFGLGQQLGIPARDAKEYIDAYFKTYPGIESYMEKTKAEAHQKGYVETLFGRKCFIPDINDRSPQVRAFSERQAINAPLQGSAADIIKKAMIRAVQLLNERKSSSKLLLQVHDELVFEIPEDELSTLGPELKKIMEGVIHLEVPLIADASVGENWGEMTTHTF
ncbi:MAG: DNA polymerase I [Alphaproteobacteria bacterium 16-39-46]|nr:MAG: DNA polymerase I [Alphaproteobacteria bacterium 16-39-46]OZA44447.1 MAG: DNA polymerase I [Alphaproteobacteria bacterium 17-39-52]HQS83333.1 DNA polymerase I [Alphaproteobacteria bacterium]HQS93652.1 DNA polymerase I [Alphaproteobacteria bacterium]